MALTAADGTALTENQVEAAAADGGVIARRLVFGTAGYSRDLARGIVHNAPADSAVAVAGIVHLAARNDVVIAHGEIVATAAHGPALESGVVLHTARDRGVIMGSDVSTTTRNGGTGVIHARLTCLRVVTKVYMGKILGAVKLVPRRALGHGPPVVGVEHGPDQVPETAAAAEAVIGRNPVSTVPLHYLAHGGAVLTDVHESDAAIEDLRAGDGVIGKLAVGHGIGGDFGRGDGVGRNLTRDHGIVAELRRRDGVIGNTPCKRRGIRTQGMEAVGVTYQARPRQEFRVAAHRDAQPASVVSEQVVIEGADRAQVNIELTTGGSHTRLGLGPESRASGGIVIDHKNHGHGGVQGIARAVGQLSLIAHQVGYVRHSH